MKVTTAWSGKGIFHKQKKIDFYLEMEYRCANWEGCFLSYEIQKMEIIGKGS